MNKTPERLTKDIKHWTNQIKDLMATLDASERAYKTLSAHKIPLGQDTLYQKIIRLEADIASLGDKIEIAQRQRDLMLSPDQICRDAGV